MDYVYTLCPLISFLPEPPILFDSGSELATSELSSVEAEGRSVAKIETSEELIMTSLAEEAREKESGTAEQLDPPRDLLQLDASLKRLRWTLRYVEASQSSPAKEPISLVAAELMVFETFALVDFRADGSIAGDMWVMDTTLKELSLDGAPKGEGGAFIIHQDLYYRKTKPPKLDGGTMDTRRSSPDDNLLRMTLSYSKENIKGIVTVVLSQLLLSQIMLSYSVVSVVIVFLSLLLLSRLLLLLSLLLLSLLLFPQ